MYRSLAPETSCGNTRISASIHHQFRAHPIGGSTALGGLALAWPKTLVCWCGEVVIPCSEYSNASRRLKDRGVQREADLGSSALDPLSFLQCLFFESLLLGSASLLFFSFTLRGIEMQREFFFERLAMQSTGSIFWSLLRVMHAAALARVFRFFSGSSGQSKLCTHSYVLRHALKCH